MENIMNGFKVYDRGFVWCFILYIFCISVAPTGQVRQVSDHRRIYSSVDIE